MPLLNQQNPLSRPIALSNVFWIIVVLLLLVGNIFTVFRYFGVNQELKSAQVKADSCQFNRQTVDFTQLFVAKVLSADQEIGFETRLELENAVRNLKDEEILDVWQKFTNSQDEAEAQNQVKALLTVLLEKIK